MSNLPLITAHSGCMNTSPNTLDSMLQGIEAGADIIEVDVRATKDGIPILKHDSFINTVSHEQKQVSQLTLGELKNYEGKNIVTLEEALNLALKYNKVFNLDMKSLYAMDSMIKIVEQKKMVNQVVLSGCDKEKALYMHKNHQKFRILLNVEDDMFKDTDYNYQSAIKKICYDAITLSCCGINIEYKYCTQELINYAHSRFLPVAIWTVDDICNMKKYLKLGVYSITTNKVNALRGLKQSM